MQNNLQSQTSPAGGVRLHNLFRTIAVALINFPFHNARFRSFPIQTCTLTRWAAWERTTTSISSRCHRFHHPASKPATPTARRQNASIKQTKQNTFLILFKLKSKLFSFTNKLITQLVFDPARTFFKLKGGSDKLKSMIDEPENLLYNTQENMKLYQPRYEGWRHEVQVVP